ncbi:hypothetical protein EB796_006602 [Bugula neritina]|uniref:Uncharacterized protein n=1 Tax=Bugula neritina TaxID=10212 RepID=A0A7J7KA80_BUGNE|nr:hypothetical protein EB796_006602 [Bugula neritina]
MEGFIAPNTKNATALQERSIKVTYFSFSSRSSKLLQLVVIAMNIPDENPATRVSILGWVEEVHGVDLNLK